MTDKDLLLVDVSEFQNKVIEYITTDKIDKMFNTTTFKDDPNCKSAMIYGMAIASMMTSQCEHYYVKKDEEKEN